jgi:hypothetical protein
VCSVAFRGRVSPAITTSLSGTPDVEGDATLRRQIFASRTLSVMPTSRPLTGVAISAGLAVGAMWGGLALSYAVSGPPPTSAIIGLAAAGCAVCAGTRRLRQPR